MSLPSLTVISIAGNAGWRTSRLLAALAGQSIASEIEVVIISLASGDSPGIACAAGLDVIVVRHPNGSDWGRARAEGVRRARAPIVAFLEDHTIPVPDWAEQVRNGFANCDASITAISYAFTNGSPDSYFYRSVFMAEYGALAHPLPEGKPPASTANNIAYRRDALLAHGPDLDALLEMDFFLQKAMKEDFRIVTAPRALVAHETNTHLRDLIPGHFLFAQLFASRRVRHEHWSVLKRLAVTPIVPIVVPLLRLKRLFQALAGRPQLRDAVAGLPVILALYVSGALGETLGLLRGSELSGGSLAWFELEAERMAK
jgi:hypothetical protein